MATNFKVSGSNFEDTFLRRDLFAQGGLWMSGSNSNGQLGNNAGGSGVAVSSPVQTVAGGTNWKDIACGYDSAAGIKSDGTLWTWGRNNKGQLGNNSDIPRSSPIQTVAGGSNWKLVSGAMNGYGFGAIKSDGTLWMWGYNNQGQIGNSSTNAFGVSSPTQTSAAGANWKSVALGYDHTVGIKTDGTIWLWGNNEYGKLGYGSGSVSSPTQTVGTATTWKSAACGWRHTAAIKTDGTLWTWGFNTAGQLGDGTSTTRYSPVQTSAGGTTWKQAAGAWYATMAIKTDGTLWTWGQGTTAAGGVGGVNPGQSGDGGTNWKFISGGYYQGTGVKTDGTLWFWGQNSYGQFGTNNRTAATLPVQNVMGGNNWKKANVSSGMSAAISDIF